MDHSIPGNFELDVDNEMIFVFTTGSTPYPEKYVLLHNPYQNPTFMTQMNSVKHVDSQLKGLMI